MSSSLRPSSHPKARVELKLRELPDGCAILDLEQDTVHLLNPSAGFILSLCDGTRTVKELVHELRSAVPSLSIAEASEAVARALSEFTTAGLLEESRRQETVRR